MKNDASILSTQKLQAFCKTAMLFFQISINSVRG